MMKDEFNGIYLNEPTLYSVDLKSAIAAANDMSLYHQDSLFEVISVDLDPSIYEECKKSGHGVIYDGDLYNDIENCISHSKYDIIHKVIYRGDSK